MEAIQFKQLSVAPENIEVVDVKLTPFVLHVLCSYVFSPSNRENMLVPLAGSGPLMNFKSLKYFKEFTEILLKQF